MMRGQGNGARRQFAREVEDRQRQLMNRNRELSELEAFRLASNEVSKEKPELLHSYRKDSESI